MRTSIMAIHSKSNFKSILIILYWYVAERIGSWHLEANDVIYPETGVCGMVGTSWCRDVM